MEGQPQPSTYDFRCPACDLLHTLQGSDLGKRLACSGCGKGFKCDQPLKEAKARAKAEKKRVREEVRKKRRRDREAALTEAALGMAEMRLQSKQESEARRREQAERQTEPAGTSDSAAPRSGPPPTLEYASQTRQKVRLPLCYRWATLAGDGLELLGLGTIIVVIMVFIITLINDNPSAWSTLGTMSLYGLSFLIVGWLIQVLVDIGKHIRRTVEVLDRLADRDT